MPVTVILTEVPIGDGRQWGGFLAVDGEIPLAIDSTPAIPCGLEAPPIPSVPAWQSYS